MVALGFLVGTVFNFTPEAHAATTHTYDDQNVTAYLGSTSGHGVIKGVYNVQYQTVAVNKYVDNNPHIPFGTRVNTTTSLFLFGPDISRSQFTVSDTIPGYATNDYLDIYYGADNSINYQNAMNFGTKYHINYTASF